MSEEAAEINPVNPEAVPKPVEPESEVDLANKRNENEKCKNQIQKSDTTSHGTVSSMNSNC